MQYMYVHPIFHGPAVECEGGSEDEGNDSSSSDKGLSEGLVDDVVFSHTPLEQQSLHTLGQIENGSLTGTHVYMYRVHVHVHATVHAELCRVHVHTHAKIGLYVCV